jgi:hypothetical protein
MEKIAGAMACLREESAQVVCGTRSSPRGLPCPPLIHTDGTACVISLPKSDTLRWLLSDESWYRHRPSAPNPAQALQSRARKGEVRPHGDARPRSCRMRTALMKGYLEYRINKTRPDNQGAPETVRLLRTGARRELSIVVELMMRAYSGVGTRHIRHRTDIRRGSRFGIQGAILESECI